MVKYCPRCKQTKSVDDFNKRNGKRSKECQAYCRKCHRKYVSDWQRTSNGKLHQERARLKYKFGITPEEVDSLLMSQCGVCALCGQQETKLEFRTGKVMSLSVDHNHKSGQIRGLLCQKCNSIIGYANEDVELLQKVIDYLKENDC